MNNYKIPNFFGRIKNFGISRLIKSYDFIISLVICIIGYFTFFNVILNDYKPVLSDMMNTSISITTVILAGFAIVISLSDAEFIKILKEYKIYENILFYFEYTTMISVMVFSISFFLKYVYFLKWVYFFDIFLFIYMLFCLIQLVSFITKFSIFKGKLFR